MYFFVLNCGHHSIYIFKEGLTLLVNEFASNKAKKERETNRGLPDITHLHL